MSETTQPAVAGPVEPTVRPQLPDLDVPLFEAVERSAFQPTNFALWKAYMALRQACKERRDCAEQLECLRRLRDTRTTWFDRDELTLRRAIDKALTLWPNDKIIGASAASDGAPS